MKYEIKIEKAQEASGTISLSRLAAMADSLRKIAEGSLRIRIKGISVAKGRKKLSLKEALEINLTGLKEGSTVISLECRPFSQTLDSFQMDMFRQEGQRDLGNKTPVSLVIQAFREAVSEETSSEFLDKPLLRELKNFKRVFLSDNEIVTIANEGSFEALQLKRENFNTIKSREEILPDPQPVLVNGKVELLHYSKQKVSIQTEEGIVMGFLSDDIDTEEIAGYWGKEITIAGISHHKPGGNTVLEIDRIFEPNEGDSYFSRKPKSETIEQQIQRQLNEGKRLNALADLVGQWSGDETEDEFDKMLKQYRL